jgi:hypothetical protein
LLVDLSCDQRCIVQTVSAFRPLVVHYLRESTAPQKPRHTIDVSNEPASDARLHIYPVAPPPVAPG